MWSNVDTFFTDHLIPSDPALADTLARSEASGLPEIQVAATHGKLLMLLAQMVGAKRILEVGTLGGYSTLWLARALGPDGSIITLEAEPHHAAVARENLEHAGVSDRVEIQVGPAATSLAKLVEAKAEPFDFFFIDADKRSNPVYFKQSLALARSGSVMVIDNVVRDGQVTDEHTTDEDVRGVRELMATIARTPGVEATALQTVGQKGYDGFLMARVK